MMVFDAVARASSGKLSLGAFREFIGRHRSAASQLSQPAENRGGISFDRFPTLEEAESYLIARALELSRGNQGMAAGMLGISRQALNNRLRRQRRG